MLYLQSYLPTNRHQQPVILRDISDESEQIGYFCFKALCPTPRHDQWSNCKNIKQCSGKLKSKDISHSDELYVQKSKV